MGRFPCSDENGLKKGPWTPEEDQKLANYMLNYGHGTWRTLPKKAGLNRCGKSCRLRWNNYLKPDIKRGPFSDQEEQLIVRLHSSLGNRWSKIASHLPGRTDNEIKNHYNTKLKKKLLSIGIDPQTHKPVVPDASHLFLPYSQLLSALNPAGGAGAGLVNMLTNALLMQNLLSNVRPSNLNVPPSSSSSMLFNNGAVGQNNQNYFGGYTDDYSLPALCDTAATTPETILGHVEEQVSPGDDPVRELIDTFEKWEELVDQEDFFKDLLA